MAEIADRSEDGADDRREGETAAAIYTETEYYRSANIDKTDWSYRYQVRNCHHSKRKAPGIKPGLFLPIRDFTLMEKKHFLP